MIDANGETGHSSHMLRFVIISATILLVAGACSQDPSDQGSDWLPTAWVGAAEKMTEGERATCRASGGEVGQGGLSPRDRCIVPYPDGGKPCTSSTQCAGACLAESGPSGDVPVSSARCQADNATFGCHTEFLDGKPVEEICAD
jgi:hypothetical protein